jgi:hypothetical protein
MRERERERERDFIKRNKKLFEVFFDEFSYFLKLKTQTLVTRLDK